MRPTRFERFFTAFWQHPEPFVTSPMFHVNQQAVRFAGDPQANLLSVLRGELGLSGPKFGCGQGECGACTVLVDGRPQTSCNLPVWSVEGSQVTTLEGLGTPEVPHALQTAFIEERAAQCGYCVSGILTAASALLAAKPSPSRQEIAQALDKHLCRCGAHNRMVRAIEKAAQQLAKTA
jgi:nicotinate dehydrogenase subunit A